MVYQMLPNRNILSGNYTVHINTGTNHFGADKVPLAA
jgi:hypothetical protein